MRLNSSTVTWTSQPMAVILGAIYSRRDDELVGVTELGRIIGRIRIDERPEASPRPSRTAGMAGSGVLHRSADHRPGPHQ